MWNQTIPGCLVSAKRERQHTIYVRDCTCVLLYIIYVHTVYTYALPPHNDLEEGLLYFWRVQVLGGCEVHASNDQAEAMSLALHLTSHATVKAVARNVPCSYPSHDCWGYNKNVFIYLLHPIAYI